MNVCDLCGKGFKFPYLLVRHLNRINTCSTNKVSVENVENVYPTEKNVYPTDKNVYPTDKNVYPTDKNEIKCDKCAKVLKSKLGLNKHYKICKGVHILQCHICFKSFSDRRSKNKHIKNGKCSPSVEKVNLEHENKALKKEIAILKATSRSTNITTTNSNNITNNYIIKYDKDTKCITSNDPNAPFAELLCFNGFKYEAASSKLKDIDHNTLEQHINNVRLSDDYYSLYTFFFRNVDNRRLHMFNMGKSSNSTHAQVFNNGSLKKIHKTTLFENVSKYIGQYLLNMSIDNLDVINKVLIDQKSKDAFMEVVRDKSHTFNYYKEKDDMLEIQEF